MVEFIDRYRSEYGVEPICRVLPIAPSTYHAHKACERDPSLRSARAKRDEMLREEIVRVRAEHFTAYGSYKTWREMNRQGIGVARCTVERLMRAMGLRGVVRGKAFKTTTGDDSLPQPADLVDRQFVATRPNQLWVSDLTYVRTAIGFVYVAFVIDVFSRRIVGWSASRSLRTELALEALEQAIFDRGSAADGRLIHHSDRGVQYLSFRYTERLWEAGIEPSVGSRGDSYDNAMAESVIGLYKAELIERGRPWRNLHAVEFATLEWVSWFNNRRIMRPLGDIPPIEFEEEYYRRAEGPLRAGLN